MWDVQQLFQSDILLRIARLTDPPRTSGHPNLTLLALPTLCGHIPSLQPSLQTAIEDAKKRAGYARKWRNKRIAHTDLGEVLQPSSNPPAPSSIAHSRAALEAVYQVLRLVRLHLPGRTHLHPDIAVEPRAEAFIARARIVSASLLYIDRLVDQHQDARPSDLSVVKTFLERLGGDQDPRPLVNLREAASWFRTRNTTK